MKITEKSQQVLKVLYSKLDESCFWFSVESSTAEISKELGITVEQLYQCYRYLFEKGYIAYEITYVRGNDRRDKIDVFLTASAIDLVESKI